MQQCKVIAFDIDGTICHTEGSDYENSKPMYDRIERVNQLIEIGVDVIYFTARGSTSGKDLYQFTFDQLVGWGCKFSKLYMGKPSFDLLVDDKAITADMYFNLAQL